MGCPIASLMMEKYLNDTISAKRLPEVERISKADLIPEAIKHWYAVKDSIKLAKLAKQIDADKAPVLKIQQITGRILSILRPSQTERIIVTQLTKDQ